LLGQQDIRHVMPNFKKYKHETLFSKQRLPYRAADGKTYQRDYTTDKGLYLLAQYLRETNTNDRPVLDEIKQFLANSGAFVDEIRLDATKVLTSGAMTPDQALDAVIEMYRTQGKSDEWIQMRLQSKIKRDEFVRALSAAISDFLNHRHYAIATNDIYIGLWGRTAARLKHELGVSKSGSLRDKQPMMGLYFQGIAEEAAADKLGSKQELTWNEGREIIQTIAGMVGRYAKEMGDYLGKDLATGRPLLTQG